MGTPRGSYPIGWPGNYLGDNFDELLKYQLQMEIDGVGIYNVDNNDSHFIFSTRARRAILSIIGNKAIGEALKIVGDGSDNDFNILGGDTTADGALHFYLAGYDVIVEKPTTYLLQNADLNGGEAPAPIALATPVGSDRTDEVYLDISLIQITGADDDPLIPASEGASVSNRLRLISEIKVEEGGITPVDFTDGNGIDHHTIPLARLNRIDAQAAINLSEVDDLRIEVQAGSVAGKSSDLEVRAQGTPDNTVFVSPGGFRNETGDEARKFLGGSTPIMAPSSGPTISRYYIAELDKATGVLFVDNQAEAVTPGNPFSDAPAVTSGREGLAIIEVIGDGAVVLTDRNVFDIRATGGGAGGGGPLVFSPIVGNSTATPPAFAFEIITGEIQISLGGDILREGASHDYIVSSPTEITFQNSLAATPPDSSENIIAMKSSLDGNALSATQVRILYDGDAASKVNNLELEDVGFPRLGTPIINDAKKALTILSSTGLTGSGGNVTDAGGGNVDVTAGIGFIRSGPLVIDELLSFGFLEALAVVIPTDTTRYVGVDYNAGTPIVEIRTTNSFDCTDNFYLATVINDSGALTIFNNPDSIDDFDCRLLLRLHETSPFALDQLGGGLVISDSADTNRNIVVTAGAAWEKLNRFNLPAIDTSGSDTFDRFYRDGAGGHTEESAQTQWDNTKFDDGTGSLATIPAGEYAVRWYYYDVLTLRLLAVYGSASYVTVGEAADEAVPADVPSVIIQQSLLLGRFIIQESATDADQVDSAFSSNLTLGGVTNHNNLTNLTFGDPHTQYSLSNGSRAFTSPILGVDPIAAQDLATKNYNDNFQHDHNGLSNLAVGDVHTQYLLKTGIDRQIASAVNTVNTASATFVDTPNMTLTTPNDGVTRDYSILFSATIMGDSNNDEGAIIVDIGGNIAGTYRQFTVRDNEQDIISTQHLALSVAPNTVIKIQWEQVGGGNIDAFERSLIIEGTPS